MCVVHPIFCNIECTLLRDTSVLRKTYPPSPPSDAEGGNRFCSPFPLRKGGRGDRSCVETETVRLLEADIA